MSLPVLRRPLSRLPGLLLTALVAWCGLRASEWIGHDLLGFDRSPVSGIMMAIAVGLVVGNLFPLPDWARSGIRFSLVYLLRLGIILLGIRLSLGDVFRLGALGIPLIALCLGGAVVVTRWLSRRLALSPKLSALVAIGTSICGASAIVATAPVIEAREEETAYAIANITLFGILAMFLYPYLAQLLFMDNPTSAGLFLGTAIHETAQVAGSGLVYADLFDAPQVLDTATVTKLVRNASMVIVIPVVALLYHREPGAHHDGRTAVRWRRLFPAFILGFLVMALARTVGDLTLAERRAWGLFDSAHWLAAISGVTAAAETLLAVAMAGVGLGTNVGQLKRLGVRPLVVGLGAALSVSILSLLGIAILRWMGFSA